MVRGVVGFPLLREGDSEMAKLVGKLVLDKGELDAAVTNDLPKVLIGEVECVVGPVEYVKDEATGQVTGAEAAVTSV
jgi:hypothetical protein